MALYDYLNNIQVLASAERSELKLPEHIIKSVPQSLINQKLNGTNPLLATDVQRAAYFVWANSLRGLLRTDSNLTDPASNIEDFEDDHKTAIFLIALVAIIVSILSSIMLYIWSYKIENT